MLVRLAIALSQHAWYHPARAEMEREAISLATHGVLGNPYSLPTGPSAHVSPGYAFVLAGIFYCFGTGVMGETAKFVLGCLISSTLCALLPWLCSLLRLPKSIGLSAGLVAALVPLNPYTEIRGDFENHLTALLLLLLIAGAAANSDRVIRPKTAVELGAFCGVCALTSPVLDPICVLALLYIGFRQYKLSTGRPGLLAISAGLAVLTLSPWVYRNYVQLGAPIITRSNFGLEFRLANNDMASPLMFENGRLFECCHPLQNQDEARKVQQLGEVRYEAKLSKEAWMWVAIHPARFMRLTALRIWYAWFPRAPEPLQELAMRILTVLSILGFGIIWRIRRESALLLAVPLLMYLTPFYIVQAHFRYRYPVEFIFVVTATAFVIAALKRIQKAIAIDPKATELDAIRS